MKGFRKPADNGRKERLRAMETELKNLQMASRISQMMVQQLMQSMKNMQVDLGNALGLINEMQYKLIAVQQVSSCDVQRLNEIANGLRLKDFNEASDKEDVKGGFTEGDVVLDDSTVILTSTAPEDKGIFRSRIKLSECGVQDIIDGFKGRPVGAKILTQLNGVDHEIELLAIRNPAPAVEVPQGEQTATAETAAQPVDSATITVQ
jgi:hypothetical protein